MAEFIPEIVYEDNHVLVAVKPPNMLSQADHTGDTDILSVLREYIRVKYNKPGNVYIGLVHRLDRPVGGLMVFAKTSKAAARLSAQMQKHHMGREYLCVVTGVVADSFTLRDYLVKDEKTNMVRVCTPETKGAQHAVLHGQCLGRQGELSLCAIRLETGRSHQIRVQMSHMGAPLWGDNRYGSGKPGQQIALWGYKLTFEHPTKHDIITTYNLPTGSVWSKWQLLLDEMRQEQKYPEWI